MDRFWDSLRIGCIGVFVLVGLGIAGCTISGLVHEAHENAGRDALWTRSMTLLQRGDGHRVRARVDELFPGADGVCVALNAAGFDERMVRGSSSAKIAMASADVARHAEQDGHVGLSDDTKIWLLYAIKDGRVVNGYQLLMKSEFDVERGDRCYGSGETLELNYHSSKIRGDTGSMVIDFAPDHA